MRIRLIGLSLILVSLWLVSCGRQEPQLALAVTRIDVGDVVNGEIVGRDVVVRNEGAGPLVVANVSTSCGCTTATLEPMTLDPGASGVLHIEFDSGAHGPDLTGPLMRQVFIASNDPQQPEAQLELVANILPRTMP